MAHLEEVTEVTALLLWKLPPNSCLSQHLQCFWLTSFRYELLKQISNLKFQSFNLINFFLSFLIAISVKIPHTNVFLCWGVGAECIAAAVARDDEQRCEYSTLTPPFLPQLKIPLFSKRYITCRQSLSDASSKV